MTDSDDKNVGTQNRMPIENEKVLKVTVLTEEFKARWQQIMALDSQTDKWMATYTIALVVGVSWILSSEKITSVNQFFLERNYDNSYFILSLAIVNATYSLYIAFMGYQIHQLRLFLYKEICTPLYQITDINVNNWEIWHRTEFQKKRKGKPEWRRVLYYSVITLLPFAVSVFILVSYYQIVGRNLSWGNSHNVFFYFVILIQLLSLILSLSVMGQNQQWSDLVGGLSMRSSVPSDRGDKQTEESGKFFDMSKETAPIPEKGKMTKQIIKTKEDLNTVKQLEPSPGKGPKSKHC